VTGILKVGKAGFPTAFCCDELPAAAGVGAVVAIPDGDGVTLVSWLTSMEQAERTTRKGRNKRTAYILITAVFFLGQDKPAAKPNISFVRFYECS
jgi:hypothetical protein